jgi:hypothetical protein
VTLYVAPVVEGHSETKCLERILQNVWTKLLAAPERLQVLTPARGSRSAMLKETDPALPTRVNDARIELRRLVAKDPTGRGMILVLLDAEDDCAATAGPQLLARARAACSDVDVACVLAVRALENWFKAAASSLGGVCDLPATLPLPDDPELGSGALWLGRQMGATRRGRVYKKVTDAPALAAKMDPALCRRNSPSFDKLCRDLEARRHARPW